MGRKRKSEERKPRKKNRILSLAERISVIYEYETVRNTKKLAQKYGCCRGQILNILWMKEKYLAAWTSTDDTEENRIRQSARMAILGAVVNEWIQRSRSLGLAVDNDQIRQIGVEISKLLTIKDFRATYSWLEHVKRTYKIFDLDPLPFEEMLPKKSLNVVDILFELKDAGADLGMPHLSRPISEQLQITCAAASHGRCNSIIELSVDPDPVESQESQLGTMEMEETGKNRRRNSTRRRNYRYQKKDGSDSLPACFFENKANPLEPIKIESSFEDDKEQKQLPLSNPDDGQTTVKNVKLGGTPFENNYDDDWREDNPPDVKDVKPLDMEIENSICQEVKAEPVASYNDALKYLKPLENFLLGENNLRALGIMRQLERLFAERLAVSSK